MPKWFSLGAIAAVLLGLTGCTHKYTVSGGTDFNLGNSIETYEQTIDDPIMEYVEENFVPAEQDSLYINTNPDEHYFLIRSREAGERDLLRLTKEGKVEESWIYIELEGQEEGIWLENGLDETPVTANMDVAPLGHLSQLEDSSGAISKISLYHFHPYDENEPNAYMPQTVSDIDLRGYLTVVYLLNNSFLQEKLDDRIVVSTGRYTLEHTDELVTCDLDDDSTNRDLYSAIMRGYKIMLGVSGYEGFDYSSENKDEFSTQNTRWAELMSNRFYSVNFEPMEINPQSIE